ncbi:MAG: Hpt domain-containing protein [Cryobacterium sp.]|nr:Hpt domain-containing protein [Oligoflexia bacterium]
MKKMTIRIPSEMADIAPAYLEKRKRDLEGLKDALNRKDFEFISKLAHKTKGTAGGYGFTEMGNLAKALELAAKSGNYAETDEAFGHFHCHVESVEIEAQRFMSGTPRKV